MIGAAARAGRSMIFTFGPEPSGFPDRIARIVAYAGGEVTDVALDVSAAEQERRLVAADRAAFGKLHAVEMLREERAAMATCMAAMPSPAIRIDTDATTAAESADLIVARLSGGTGSSDPAAG